MKKVLLVLGMLAVCLSPAAALADDTLAHAVSLAGEERYAEAREALDPLLAREPDHPWGRLLDGLLLTHEGSVSKAIEVFERLRRDHPDMSEPWNNLAVLYAVEERFDEARDTLLPALDRRPSAIGYTTLGEIYAGLARRAYARARALESGGSVRPEWGGEIGPAPSSPGAASPAASAEAPAAGLGGAPGACVRTAGFEERRAPDRAAQWLRSQGAEAVVVHAVDRSEIMTRQVYLPPLANRAEAAAKVRKLRARGLRDVAVIGSGELVNGISFGVYGVAANMRRRVAALERLDYPVQSRDNVKTVREYVVEARAAGDPNALRAAWTARFPRHSIDLVDCG